MCGRGSTFSQTVLATGCASTRLHSSAAWLAVDFCEQFDLGGVSVKGVRSTDRSKEQGRNVVDPAEKPRVSSDINNRSPTLIGSHLDSIMLNNGSA